MIVSFTGTRHGMSAAQSEQLRSVLRWLANDPTGLMSVLGQHEFRNGWAEGADKQADRLAREFSGYTVTRWPPKPEDKSPLDRDKRDLALPCDIMIAAPKTDREELRSGTWATIRYARAAGKPVVMLSRGGK